MIRKHFLLTARQIVHLKDLVKSEGKSEGEHVRNAIDEYLARKAKESSASRQSPSGRGLN